MNMFAKKTKGAKGFTLIELLVVVAIIAILSATILVALNSARKKAKDAKIQSEMSDLRAQMELFYTSNTSSYTSSITSCTSGAPFATTTNNGAGTLVSGILADNGNNAMACATDSAGQSWVVISPLVSTSGTFWCVDSNGASKQETGLTYTSNTSGVSCP